ncbi:hypothetical protein LJC72_11425, partial [Bacteroides sp. OttesenSCG-928-D19]|nr:hypothetical protein [Bacteroides sp. OttesenSCG-928-D19]
SECFLAGYMYFPLFLSDINILSPPKPIPPSYIYNNVSSSLSPLSFPFFLCSTTHPDNQPITKNFLFFFIFLSLIFVLHE